MNLNAYDSITEKIDKTKTWIDTKKCILLSREIKYRKYYVLSRRFNTELNTYELVDRIGDNDTNIYD